ncbi:unnamed protein product [Acanthoscelides obtectus]|uniref:Uncharacterized protein n=1 Tax=Acanthoscelides obtectus TaxID=200917 RepID=A0A9P0VQ75_ACAOB|nr:unnamed protein product [Acanthoscelides obtectus]CAK1685886.1 hypothetical protein AOBTE_LOCUS35694 [Acanthoscelides obtectus]
MNAAARRQDQSVSKDADREYEMEKENELDEFDSDFIDTEDENCTDGQELERQKKSREKGNLKIFIGLGKRQNVTEWKARII